MRRRILYLLALGGACALQPLHAQSAGVTADLLKQVDQAESKFTRLADALSIEQYSWRPEKGVRSVQEVLLHVAVDNYFIPLLMGVPAPAAVKISSTTDFAALGAFEKQSLSKEATIAEVKASFEHLRKALNSIPESRMSEQLKVFGTDFTMRQFMILATTHMHEHLGQLIAYARSNHVVPPWSQGN